MFPGFRSFSPVIPAMAGIHVATVPSLEGWIPAFAGMTVGALSRGASS